MPVIKKRTPIRTQIPSYFQRPRIFLLNVVREDCPGLKNVPKAHFTTILYLLQDILVVFREDSQPDEGGTPRQPRLLSKKIRRHVYSVVMPCASTFGQAYVRYNSTGRFHVVENRRRSLLVNSQHVIKSDGLLQIQSYMLI